MVQKKRLGEIALLQRGLTYNKGDEVPSSSKVVLRSNNIDLDSHSLDLSELKYLREDFVIPEDRKVKKDSIFICMSNGSKQHVGKVAYIDRDMDYAFGGFMGLIVPKPSISSKYVFYACNSSSYRTFLSQIGNGIGITNLRFSDLEQFEVPVPSIEEQQRIVAELDLLTSIIDKKNAQLRDLDALAQSIFYEMFGNPVTNDKGWPKKRIGELVHLYNGRAFKPSDWTESGLPIVRIQNLNSPDSPYNFYDGVVDEAYLLKGGELLYAWSGTPGTSFGAHIWKGNKAVLNQHIFKVLFDEKYLNKLYFLYQLNLSVSSLFDQTHGGVGLKHITKGTLENQLVPLPNMELQNSFAQKVLAIDSEKDRLKCSLLQTKTLLESRMSEYFNTK